MPLDDSYLDPGAATVGEGLTQPMAAPGGWKAWASVPENRAMLIQTGLNLYSLVRSFPYLPSSACQDWGMI